MLASLMGFAALNAILRSLPCGFGVGRITATPRRLAPSAARPNGVILGLVMLGFVPHVRASALAS